MKSVMALVCAAGVVAAAGGTANAQYFRNNFLVITEVNDGTAAPTNAASQVSVREFSRGGVFTGTALTFGTSTAGARLTTSGVATSEGYITRSAGTGRYLTVSGYDAATGTGAIAGTTNNAADGSGPVRRAVGRIDTWTGAVDYSGYGQTYSGNNPRSSVFDEVSSTIIMSGAGTPGGVRSGPLGGATSTTSLTGNLANTRVVNVANGQVVTSSASGAFLGLSLVSGGSATLIVGLGAGSSAYDFYFADTRTVYIADDRTSAAGGLLKWTRSGGVDTDLGTGTWAAAATFNLTGVSGTSLAGLRGLAGETVGGVTTLFGISTDNRLVSFTDTGVGSAFATLASAPVNTNWRGVEIIPTPGAMGVGAMGLLLAARRRRA